VAVESEDFIAEEGADCARQQSGDGEGEPPEGEDGEGESAGGLLGGRRTTKASNPAAALPVTLSCSRLRFSVWILWRSASSR
jgi:hypothetical protein